MDRRSFLAGLGAGAAGVSGCLSLGPVESTETATRTPPVCDAARPRRFELVSTGDVPAEADISITASVERARPSAENPALVEVKFTNEGSDRAIAFPDTGQCHPFNRQHGLSEPRGLQLHYRDYMPYDRAEPCWTRDAAPGERDPGWDGYGCPQEDIESGESVTYPLEIWDDFRIDGYAPPGTYRFTSDDVDVPSTGSLDWWFDLEATNPER